MLREGKSPSDIPADAIMSPAAQDLLKNPPAAAESNENSSTSNSWSPTPPPAPNPAPAAGPPWEVVREDIEAFYNSDHNQRRKEEICDVGRRMWAREYVDGNGGNISIRVGKNLALCTPTLVSKGFMRPAQICLVDLDGNQKAGAFRRTSEILMHLEIMKAQPKAVACVHCHPPYATAFAASGIKPPNNILPEFELFIGEVPIAEYETPGTIDMARVVAGLADNHNTILMANHGVVAWSPISVEDAYFKMEILEAYCRTIMVTTQLGRMPNRFTAKQMKDLLEIKKNFGVPDARYDWDIDQLQADEAQWRPGVTCMPPSTTTTDAESSQNIDELIDQITAAIIKKLGSS